MLAVTIYHYPPGASKSTPGGVRTTDEEPIPSWSGRHNLSRSYEKAAKEEAKLRLGSTRFRGHLTIWEKGVHDAKEETALCG